MTHIHTHSHKLPTYTHRHTQLNFYLPDIFSHYLCLWLCGEHFWKSFATEVIGFCVCCESQVLSCELVRLPELDYWGAECRARGVHWGRQLVLSLPTTTSPYKGWLQAPLLRTYHAQLPTLYLPLPPAISTSPTILITTSEWFYTVISAPYV